MEAGKYVPFAVLALKLAQVFGRQVEQLFALEDGDLVADLQNMSLSFWAPA